MKNQKDYSKLDGVLKVLLILFISLLSFSTGVYAGKKFSEKQYDLVSLNSKEYSKEKFPTHASEEDDEETELPLSQKEIESLSEESVRIAQSEEHEGAGGKESVAPNRDIASAHGQDKHDTHDSKVEGKHEAARDTHCAANTAAHGAATGVAHAAGQSSAKSSEKLSEKSLDVGKSRVESQTLSSPAHASAARTGNKITINEHGADATQPSTAARRIASGTTPSQNVAPKTQPHSLTLPQGVGTQVIEYTVQVGSYPTEAEAKSHANDLTAKGFPSFTVPAQIKGQTWHRVSVGSFKTAEEANQYKSGSVKKTSVKSAYVQKITK